MTIIYKAAHILTPQGSSPLKVLSPGYLVVDDGGKIVAVSKTDPRLKFPKARRRDLGEAYLVPGLIDTHTHVPQYAFAGLGESTLLTWLQKYTFPQEVRFSKAEIARFESRQFFRECLRNGTTSVVAYVTSDREATHIAFEEAKRSGMRAFLGLVLMDRGPEKRLLRGARSALSDCKRLHKRWHTPNGRLQFVVTPRFALSCSRELLEAAGRFAVDNNLYLQTHLSESVEEIREVLKFHSWAKSYTDVYARTGCLHKKALLGHCIHLTKSEIELVKKFNSIVVHCPTSNRFLASGTMPLKSYLSQNISVTLGTDVAGGYNLSMFHEAREASEAAKNLKNPIDLERIFYLATLGAAKALGIDDRAGSLEVGKDADFVVLDATSVHPLGREANCYLNARETLARFIYRACPNMVRETHICGKRVFQNNFRYG